MSKHCDTCTCESGCPTCRKWKTWVANLRGKGQELNCHGCRKACVECTC